MRCNYRMNRFKYIHLILLKFEDHNKELSLCIINVFIIVTIIFMY
jgi:hypothetical protein